MLNLGFMIEKDRREAAKLEKRKIFEEERKKRIFNAKTRLIGVDTKALDTQLIQKQKKKDEERLVDEIFVEQLKKADALAVALAEKDKKERHLIELEINKFRQTFQKPQHRREYDLNDPDHIKKQLPMRINDDDPRLGPSSVQKFEGEDVVCQERRKIQRDQLKAWLDQQIMEKEQAEKERQTAVDAYRAAILARDKRSMEITELEMECRKRLEIAVQRFNTALSEEKRIREERSKREIRDDNMAEIYNAMTSDLLTENPDVANSNLGQNRKIGYLYKGMTDEEKVRFKEAQWRQIQEAKKEKEFQKRAEKEFGEYFTQTQKTILILDKEIEEAKKKMTIQIREENRKLAVEQKNKEEFINKIVYKNTPTEEYYNQFNTTTR
ncbi:unnamed protein product [Brassicogethes aeneus]|uniref:RIB43A-like with coiled-coils protein 2 n=1 Tax=Brassicogethes aeneus TaxID=1431903 RepID=A0A9P0BC81_BRAAE|nr:unnamed protein product [Brassicogethes aeneus]